MGQAICRVAAFSLSLLLVWAVTDASSSQAGETVTLRLQSGRSFTAQIDARSDEDRLWLRFGDDSKSIRRPVRWDVIVAVLIDEKEISLEELRTIVQEMDPLEVAPPALLGRKPDLAPGSSEVEDAGQIRVQEGRRHSQPQAWAPVRTGPASTVQAVHFYAQIANWDGDVEADGLIVAIYPSDALGRTVPASGTLEVELVAAKRQASHSIPRGRGQVAKRLGHWTRQIRASDFAVGQAQIRLPFQAAHPEFNTSWASHGLVHVRLVVPGQGVFESSQDAVRIRPYAPSRDALQLRNKSRFLASERTDR